MTTDAEIKAAYLDVELFPVAEMSVRIVLHDLLRRIEELESGPFVGSPYPITEAYLNDTHQMDIDECILEAMKDQ